MHEREIAAPEFRQLFKSFVYFTLSETLYLRSSFLQALLRPSWVIILFTPPGAITPR